MRRRGATLLLVDLHGRGRPALSPRSASVDVVYVRFSAVSDEDVAMYARWLSATEHERRVRLRLPERERRFVIGKGLVRQLVGDRLGIDPRRVELLVKGQGKPALPSSYGLALNVSHSADLLAVGLCTDCSIGVDIEAMLPRRGVVDGALSPVEMQRVRALPENTHVNAFLAAFTRKEAYLKGVGCGLAAPLHTIAINHVRDGVWGACPRAPADDAGDGWAIQTLRPPAGYVGAVAAATGVLPFGVREGSVHGCPPVTARAQRR